MRYKFCSATALPCTHLVIPQQAAMAVNYYIGQRLSFSGALCTVRYIGTVQGTKGEWLGVEWDDPTRGKHAGEHEGVKYFECEIIPICQTKTPLFG